VGRGVLPGALALLILLAIAGPAGAWDRDAAVSHAEAHWNDTTDTQPGGYNDGTWGGGVDCTNYASNSLFAGGVHMDSVGGSGWWRRHLYNGHTYYWDWSLKWVGADAFRTYFAGKSGCSDVGAYSWGLADFPNPPNQSPMIRGDFVSVNWDKTRDNETDHIEFAVGYGTSLPQGGPYGTYTGDLIDQHSAERHKAIWHMRDRKSLPDLAKTVFRIYHLANTFTN
jgi:hypothetical protein